LFSILLLLLLIGRAVGKDEAIREENPDKTNTQIMMYHGNTIIPISQIHITPKVLGVLSVDDDHINFLIDELCDCESGCDTLKVNRRDTDGTPSYYCFQFKPSTWRLYVKKYDLFEWQSFYEEDWWNTMASCDLQREVVSLMFRDPDVRLRSGEFPGCSKILNLRENYAY
jgi:hypothetical protein